MGPIVAVPAPVSKLKAVTAFVCGAVASLMPTIVNFFAAVNAGKNLPVTNWPVFVGVAAVYALAAGLFTSWWEPESKFKAVWIGVSFSTIITSLLQRTPGLPNAA
jgi:hypothetical protein